MKDLLANLQLTAAAFENFLLLFLLLLLVSRCGLAVIKALGW